MVTKDFYCIGDLDESIGKTYEVLANNFHLVAVATAYKNRWQINFYGAIKKSLNKEAPSGISKKCCIEENFGCNGHIFSWRQRRMESLMHCAIKFI